MITDWEFISALDLFRRVRCYSNASSSTSPSNRPNLIALIGGMKSATGLSKIGWSVSFATATGFSTPCGVSLTCSTSLLPGIKPKGLRGFLRTTRPSTNAGSSLLCSVKWASFRHGFKPCLPWYVTHACSLSSSSTAPKRS